MINETLKKIIKKNFPPLEIAIAYGSAVFPQKNHVGKMIDLMFLVDNSKEFHKHNLIMNPKHYSVFSSFLKEDFISKVNNYGTGMYFNPMIHVDDIYLKYGVIEIRSAINVMDSWNNLFFSGRLHKPVT
jgi:translocator assembly and maintenance protein 41